MHFDTKKQAKTTVSALRRELKGFDKPASALSHNECLTILAKALGHKSWNELEAKLPEDSPLRSVAAPASTLPAAPKYPLKNTGQFDFVKHGEDGKLMHGSFMELIGACEIIPGICSPESASRSKTGLAFMGDGETKMDWDNQETERNALGETLWMNGDCNVVPETALVLLPKDYDADPQETDPDYLEDQEELPLREALLAAYREYFAEQGIALTDRRARAKRKSLLEKAGQVIGFALTTWEADALLDATAAAGTQAVQPEPVTEESREMRAYRVVFNRVFADEGDEGQSPAFITKVMDTLKSASLKELNGTAEDFLRKKVSPLITLNGPYDRYSVADMASRLRSLAKTAFEAMLTVK